MKEIVVNYNTGRHVSENGQSLALLLDQLLQEIPGFYRKLHIVAHSMGGLVARSALYQAEMSGMAFLTFVDKVFFLATPHRGAILEKGVQLSRILLQAAHLSSLSVHGPGSEETLPKHPRGGRKQPRTVGGNRRLFIRKVPTFYINLADRILDMRSDGIRDLSYGYLVREEWDRQEEQGGLKSHKIVVPPPPGVRCYAIAGCLLKKEATEHSLIRTDGMVSTASAANMGRDDELGFVENGRYRELPGVRHFVMPFNREVCDVLRTWMSEGLSSNK